MGANLVGSSASHFRRRLFCRHPVASFLSKTPLAQRTSTFTSLSRSPRKFRELRHQPGSLAQLCHSRTFSTPSSSSRIGLFQWYLGKLESNPVITKSCTTALIYAAADCTSQMIASNSTYDLSRTIRMAGFGLILLGPTQHVWFSFVSRILPKRDVLTTFKKIVMGQTVFGPTSSSIFFSYNAALQGENRTEIVARLKRDLLPTLISGLMYWPLCDFVTFKYVPVHLQFMCIHLDNIFDVHRKLVKSCS